MIDTTETFIRFDAARRFAYEDVITAYLEESARSGDSAIMDVYKYEEQGFSWSNLLPKSSLLNAPILEELSLRKRLDMAGQTTG